MPPDPEANVGESSSLAVIVYRRPVTPQPSTSQGHSYPSSVVTSDDQMDSDDGNDKDERIRIRMQGLTFEEPLDLMPIGDPKQKKKKTPAQIQAKKNKRKAARERKRNGKLVGADQLNVGRPCKFAPYGCDERVVNEEESHETYCLYYCPPEIDSCWKAIQRHEHKYRGVFKVWALVRETASSYGTPASGINSGHEDPFVIPAKSCWVRGEIPTIEEFNADILVRAAVVDRTVHIGKAFTGSAFCNFDRIKGQVQKTEHTPADAEGLVGLQPYEIFKTYKYRLPEPLHGWYTKPAASVTMSVTPTFIPTDIHGNMGMSTISVHHGGLVNIWLIWPPTGDNWGHYYNQRDLNPFERTCFEKTAKYLSGGQVVILKPGEGLFLPPGWLSFSYTLSGGYMTKIMIIAPEQLSCAFTCLSRELKSFHSGNLGEVESNILFFMNSLCEYMQDSDARIADYAATYWIRLIEVLIKTRDTGYIIGPRIINKVSDVLGLIFNLGLTIDCPCGNMVSCFGHHFLVHGLGGYTPPPQMEME